MATRLGKNFNGGDVGNDACALHRPLDDRESGEAKAFLGYPRGGSGVLDQVAHVAAAEPLGRLKAHLFDGVEIIEVVGLKETIVHWPLGASKWKRHPRRGWLLQR